MQTPPKPTTGDSHAVATCKAEHLKIGSDAFKAKYGATETLVKAHTFTVKPSGDDGAPSVAGAFCNTEAKSLGTAVFVAKYGPQEAMGSCVKAALAKAKALVASCTAGKGSSKDAFRSCIAAGVQPRRG